METEMPVWLQVIYAIVAPVLLSVAGWVTVQVWNMRIRMAELEADIQNIKPKCERHDAMLSGLNSAVSRIDRNIVRLGMASGVKDIENHTC
jgi:hypothetical protein